MGKDGDRRNPEDGREDEAAVKIDSLRPFFLLRVVQDDRRYDLDQRKKHDQRAR